MNKQFLELTNPQWEAISPFFNLKRRRKLDLREVMNALLFLVRTGCQWRNLPPKWQAVCYYFDKWKTNGLLEKINRALNKLDRKLQGREEWPSILYIDSQIVKLPAMIFENRGVDANKKVNGRKRQLLVDSGGRLWFAHAHAANVGDGPAGLFLAADILCFDERLKKIYGDEAYNGIFADKMKEFGIDFEKASRPEPTKGFVSVAKSWVVERTITRTNYFRRLVKD